MPLLTTMLLYKGDNTLAENMKAFEEMIKLNSLTQDEIYLRNAMKTKSMHEKAIEIIQDEMHKLVEQDSGDDPIRLANTDIFL